MAASPARLDQLEAEAFRRIYPDVYYQKFLDQSVRPDGRPLALPRPVSFGLDVVTSADASALVKVGSSTALAGVKCELMAPTRERPSEGAVTTAVELAPLCSPTARPGRPSEPAAVLTAQLAALLAAPGVLDLHQLCIDPAKAAWAVYVDVYVLDDDGALHDVCTAAAVAALSTLRLPSVAVDAAGNVKPAPPTLAGATTDGTSAGGEPSRSRSSSSSRGVVDVQLGRVPFSLTCALHSSGLLIVDPTAEEERIAGALVTTTVDDNNLVLSMKKVGGGVAATTDQLRRCYEAAAARSGQMGQALKRALNERQQRS